MRIITLNLNGIRSAVKKGFFEWLAQQQADVVCVQETKAQFKNWADTPLYCPPGFHCYYSDAEKKGYSGVGIYCKHEPKEITDKLGWPSADGEGRYIQADFDTVNVVSLYMPSGTSGPDRQKIKYDFMELYLPLLKKIKESQKPFIICGDWNIAHQKIDLKNWRGNQKNSGFLPEERAWMDQVFTEIGLIDAFRVINQEPEQYTWWSHRGQAWAKNVGWRIDYQIISPQLQHKIQSVTIYKEQRFSDHAPLIIDYEL